MHGIVAAAMLAVPALAQQAPPGQLVEGRVFDVLGEPQPAAHVEVVRHGAVVQRTVADGEGCYRVRLPAGGADLRAHSGRKQSALLAWFGPTTPRIRHLLVRDVGPIDGTVRDEHGAAVAGALVFATDGQDSRTTHTDADGRYELHDVPLGRGLLLATTSTGETVRRVDFLANDTLDLTLARYERTTCLVRATGLPATALAGAAVRVFGTDPAAIANGGMLPLRADGSAPVPIGRMAIVQVLADGFVGDPESRVVERGQGELRLPMVPGNPPVVLVRGCAIDAFARPVPDLPVVVRDRSGRDLATGRSDARGRLEVPVPLGSERFCRLGIAATDGFVDDPASTTRDGHSWLAFDDVRGDVRLHVAAVTRLVTRPIAADGQGLPFVVVRIANPAAPHLTLFEVHGDGTGEARIGLPEGDYELLAVGLDGAVCTAVLDTRRTPPQPLVWQPVPTGTLEGQLCTAAGEALPGAALLLASTELRQGDNLHAARRQKVVVLTDRDGRFRGRGLPAGEWTIAAVDDARVQPASALVVAGERTTMPLLWRR